MKIRKSLLHNGNCMLAGRRKQPIDAIFLHLLIYVTVYRNIYSQTLKSTHTLLTFEETDIQQYFVVTTAVLLSLNWAISGTVRCFLSAPFLAEEHLYAVFRKRTKGIAQAQTQAQVRSGQASIANMPNRLTAVSCLWLENFCGLPVFA